MRIELLLDYQDNVKSQFDPNEIFNTDQSGFNYIVNTNRTLSHMSERITTATVNSLFPLTHSYTIQPLLSMSGQLTGRLYVNLREKDGKFGPQVINTMANFSNLYVTCTSSGKLNKNLVKNGRITCLKTW